MLNLVFIEIISECDIFDTEIIRIEQPEIGELIANKLMMSNLRESQNVNFHLKKNVLIDDQIDVEK